MSLRLIALDCPACGSAMAGAPQDMLYFCPHCGSGATLGKDGLETVESTALLAAPGRHPTTWRPAWLITADVVVDQRIRADGRQTEGSRGARTFVVPAFDLPLADLVELSRALAEGAATAAEVPHEAIRGGTLSLADALTLVRHVVVGDEVRKPDMLASVQVEVTETGHRLAAIPFEELPDGRLRCAVTGVTIRPQ